MKPLFIQSLIFPVLLFSVSSCSFFQEKGCDLQEKIVESGKNVISETLRCKNRGAIESSLERSLSKTKMCERGGDVKALDGSSLCKTSISSLILVLGNVAVPKEWECEPEEAGRTLSDALLKLTKICDKKEDK